MNYNHKEIEIKWQKKWDESRLYEAKNDKNLPKYYCLIEFPYPSGDGLHVGHIRSNTAMDIIARKRRAEGFNVLYPIGYDSFGLPTENYAIKTGIAPQIVTEKNTEKFRKQLKSVGFSFDWSREIDTSNPEYYRWTQWIFIQMFKKGLAYKSKVAINWCVSCKIGLANEEVVDGKCERCGEKTEKKEKEQWMLAIRKYADRLDKDLDRVDYLERIKIQQRNWIGKSEGSLISFEVKGYTNFLKIDVFTTRPDTLFGVTYIVLAPEHPLIKDLLPAVENKHEVEVYMTKTQKKTEFDRMNAKKEKTGVELKGITVVNPANGENVPVWIADYVLVDYATGAVMAVPAHDERDCIFAQNHKLSVKTVIEDGKLVNSGEFNGIGSEDAMVTITDFVKGKRQTTYKLRDWVFSRQRYWGEPIPLILCKTCGWVSVPEKDLPVRLPKVDNYKPTDNGESPLAIISEWVNTTCPCCGGDATRETDTMPNWAGSSWYYIRYIDNHNNQDLVNKEEVNHWLPVDWYNGGMEHVTLHLLYSRFWHKFLYDIGVVPTDEPYKKRTAHGMILAENGEKMSKSKGNVISPDSIIDMYGADALRIYEMFMGPFDQPIIWSTDSVIGCRRFIEKICRLEEKVYEKVLITEKSREVESLLHMTIKKVSDDIEGTHFNTAISSLMILVNRLEKEEKLSRAHFEILLRLISPFAPHISDELWNRLGNKESIHIKSWLKFDPSKVVVGATKLMVQIDGKTRDFISFDESKILQEEVEKMVLQLEKVKKWIENKEVKKVVYVKGKLINFVLN